MDLHHTPVDPPAALFAHCDSSFHPARHRNDSLSRLRFLFHWLSQTATLLVRNCTGKGQPGVFTQRRSPLPVNESPAEQRTESNGP